MEIEVFTLCDFAQQTAGKMSIIGTFDVIYAKEIPTHHPCFVALRLRFPASEAGAHSMQLTLFSDDGKEVSKVNADFGFGVALVGDHSTVNIPIGMTITLEKLGKYKFELKVDNEFVSWLEFHVAKPQ